MASQSSDRFGEIDLLRTMAIVLMIVYHAAFDLSAFFGFPLDPMSGGWFILERITANLFLLLVGVSFAISWERMERKGLPWTERLKRTAKRALVLLLCGELVALATAFIDVHTYVRFGVLHCIAVSILLLAFLMRCKEWNALLGIAVILIAPLVAQMPVATPIFLPLGFTPPTFATVDYFPLFPWLGTMLIGAAVGNLLYNRGLLRWHLEAGRTLTFPGRHSLTIYLLHQPMLIGCLWLLLKR